MMFSYGMASSAASYNNKGKGTVKGIHSSALIHSKERPKEKESINQTTWKAKENQKEKLHAINVGNKATSLQSCSVQLWQQ